MKIILKNLFNLIIASINGQLDIVKFLFEKGADINCTNKLGNTPLHEGKTLF